MGRFCRWTGRLSYPLYMSHYPAIYIYDHWLDQGHPSQPLIWVVSVGLYIGLIAMAWAITKYYDEPLRAYLGRKLST
jgi:peptidoglycan/LPS O-acetylase OafA/YrhL